MFFLFVYVLLLFYFVYSYFNMGWLIDIFLCSVGGVDLSFTFLFDFVSFGFFSCVSFISGMVFFYSMFYMDGTVDSRRFFWLVFGFVFSMFVLVFSGNFFLVMVGWDGLGLISFCLVIFYSNHSSLESGLVTVFSNRVGDVFFLLSFYFFFVGGAFFFEVGSVISSFLFFLFVFLGAITKSAQLPFSAWLPAAMAAPTPVSSLVHSSTLVTAGVYVLIRFFYLFSFFSYVYLKLFFVLTMFIAGMGASFENDFKKVVAMSTLSQLGMMLFILSVGVWVLSFLHMIIHAFFKSMLFLSTGSLMSDFGGNQDSRFYSGSVLSFSSMLFFLVSCVCLAGFPFYIGFYSKDFIILSSSVFMGFLFYFIFVGGCVFTVFYSIRLLKVGYSSWVKSYSFSFFHESIIFLFSVYFLFMKCWVLGGLFYWLFLFDSLVFMNFFDVFVGLILVFFCLYVSNKFKLFYKGLYYICMISFMRWFSSSGTSFFFKNMYIHKFDTTWMEVLGGQSVYILLSSFSVFLKFYTKVGLGLIFMCLFMFFFVFLF